MNKTSSSSQIKIQSNTQGVMNSGFGLKNSSKSNYNMTSSTNADFNSAKRPIQSRFMKNRHSRNSTRMDDGTFNYTDQNSVMSGGKIITAFSDLKQ